MYMDEYIWMSKDVYGGVNMNEYRCKWMGKYG